MAVCDNCGQELPAGCLNLGESPDTLPEQRQCSLPPRTDQAFLIGWRVNSELHDWRAWRWFNDSLDAPETVEMLERMGRAAIAAPIRQPILVGQAILDAVRAAHWWGRASIASLPDFSSESWNEFLTVAGRAALGLDFNE
jgi:hypothetical protein